jgi:hypothetical protein
VTFVDWSDLHRWKMINKALELPFEEPAETYSSSEHFAHDMGIAPGIKGRVIPEGQVVIERKPRDDRGGGRGGSSGGGSRGGRDGGSRDSRGGGRGGRDSGGERPARTEAPAASADGDKPARASRNRNRRRTRGGGEGGAPAAQQPAE